MFGPTGPYCQSCGMPLPKDDKWDHEGEYCSRCFTDGKFTDPDISLEQMRAFMKVKIKKMGIPIFLAEHYVKDMQDLKRWRKS